MLLFRCVDGGSSQTPPSSAIDIKTEQLYAGFAIDTDSPVISSFAGEAAVRGFLTKQPAMSEFNQLASPVLTLETVPDLKQKISCTTSLAATRRSR